MNKIVLTGYLATEPELKTTQNGNYVARANIAVRRPYTQDTTDFFTLIFWNKKAEAFSKYFKKGSGIEISGVLVQKTWDDQNGNKRHSIEINVDDFEFAKKSKRDSQGNDEAGAPTSTPTEFQIVEEDDIPF